MSVPREIVSAAARLIADFYSAYQTIDPQLRTSALNEVAKSRVHQFIQSAMSVPVIEQKQRTSLLEFKEQLLSSVNAGELAETYGVVEEVLRMCRITMDSSDSHH